MEYGIVKVLLAKEFPYFNDTVLIESPFREKSRNGKHVIRFSHLGLTPNALIIAKVQNEESNNVINRNDNIGIIQEIIPLSPWHSLQLRIYKKSKIQCLKTVRDKTNRYFVLEDNMPKKKLFWKLWCFHIKELYAYKKTWPFTNLSNLSCYDVNTDQTIVKENKSSSIKCALHYRPAWRDKYLYLGPLREEENKIELVPVPGLGGEGDIKLYLNINLC